MAITNVIFPVFIVTSSWLKQKILQTLTSTIGIKWSDIPVSLVERLTSIKLADG